jgi:hypothetical protein
LKTPNVEVRAAGAKRREPQAQLVAVALDCHVRRELASERMLFDFSIAVLHSNIETKPIFSLAVLNLNV